jgi:hypothetical protein
VSTTLLISLITTLPLTLNPLTISEVLTQAPSTTPEEPICEGVYLNQQGRDDYEKGRLKKRWRNFSRR